MKKLLVLVCVGAAALAQNAIDDRFEVKEIDAVTIQKLTAADARLAAATEALKGAQEQVSAAQAARDSIAGQIKASMGHSQGECHVMAGSDGTPRRPTRTVEIRGKYALITDKAELCTWERPTSTRVRTPSFLESLPQ